MARENTDVEPVPEDVPGIRGFIARMRADFDAHNHDGTNSKRFLTLLAETLSARALSLRKRSYTDNTVGLWAGLVNNTIRLFLGSASAYLKWTGTALQIAGDIVAGSLSIGDNASIDSDGNATFISMTSLNLKAYTNFETAGRFIGSVGGSGSNSFGNQGVTVAPGTTGTSYARLLWWITNHVFANKPNFTCSMLALGGFEAGDGRAYVGLGNPAITGSGITRTSEDIAGFFFQKVSGVTTLTALNNNGDASNVTETTLTTVDDNDSLELFLKFTGTSIKFYYRKNGGTITLGATHTTRIPTVSETYVAFMSTNSATTDNFQLQMQCAAYEH